VRHLLPNAVTPISQAFALLAGFVVDGAIVVENIFGYPGLGTLLVRAVLRRNVPVVQTLGLLMVTAVILSFLLADLLTLAVNPTIRNRQP
jgi:peptide/nickel transport system permease protein